jgi:hypothetical protein
MTRGSADIRPTFQTGRSREKEESRGMIDLFMERVRGGTGKGHHQLRIPASVRMGIGLK